MTAPTVTAPTELLWRTASRGHDWTDLATPSRLLDAWIGLGLVSSATWVEPLSGRRRRRTVTATDLVAAIAEQPRGDDGRIFVHVGDDAPGWTLTALLFPALSGMSLITLAVATPDGAIPAPSDALRTHFLALHTPDTTESAFVHAEPQFTRLATGVYRPPLVTGPSCPGILWASFLGGGHLADFSVPTLRRIEAYHTKWHDDRGVSLVSAPRLEDALTPSGEEELLRLTAAFRAAKR